MRISTHVKALRRARALTQVELAAKSGVAQPSISKIESGVVRPDLVTAVRLLDALGADLVVVIRDQSEAK